MKKTKFIKSDAENQFEIDEQLINEVAEADEFKDVDISSEDIIDAVAAIDALADAVIEKADAEEKELDADQLLDEIRDMIDETHEDVEKIEEEEELPEELMNSAVRVMVSEDGAVEVETKPDEVYASDVDGLECTMYDTCTLPPVDVEETGTPTEETEDGETKAQEEDEEEDDASTEEEDKEDETKSLSPEMITEVINKGIANALGDDFADKVASKMFGDLDKSRSTKDSKFEQYKKSLETKEEPEEVTTEKSSYSSKEAAEFLLRKQKAANPIMAAALKNLD